MTNNMPCYSISSEEFVQDYLLLPDCQKLILFKLRMGYSMKNSSLTIDDIDGLCPAFNDQEKSVRQKVLDRFFHCDNGLWIDDRLQSAIDAKNKEEIRRNAIRDKRSAAGKMSAQQRLPAKQKETTERLTSEQNSNKTAASVQQVLEQNPNMCSTNAQQNDNKCSTCVEQVFNKKSTNVQHVLEQNPNMCSTNAQQNGSKTSTNVGTNVQQVSKNKEKFVANPLNDQEITVNESQKAVSATSHTHAHTRASDSDFNYLYINKNNKSDSDVHAHTHAREDEPDLKINQEKIKKIFDEKVNAAWSFDEAFELLKQAGLNGQMLHQWLNRKSQNYFKFMQISKSMNLFDAHRFVEVIERCKTAKIKEKREFSTAIAFVVKALEKELESMQTQTSPPRQQPQKFSERDYWKGVVRLPDGSLRVAPKELRK